MIKGRGFNSSTNLAIAKNEGVIAVKSKKIKMEGPGKIDPEVIRVMSEPLRIQDKGYDFEFGKKMSLEGFHIEFKASAKQKWNDTWKIIKREVPRNIVAGLNCASGTISIYIGIADNGQVIGSWLTDEQRQRLPEMINLILRTKVNRLVINGTHYSLSLLTVNPLKLQPVNGAKLYVIRIDVDGTNPTDARDFYAVKNARSRVKNQVFLRVGCAQLFSLSRKDIQDLVQQRTRNKPNNNHDNRTYNGNSSDSYMSNSRTYNQNAREYDRYGNQNRGLSYRTYTTRVGYRGDDNYNQRDERNHGDDDHKRRHRDDDYKHDDYRRRHRDDDDYRRRRRDNDYKHDDYRRRHEDNDNKHGDDDDYKHSNKDKHRDDDHNQRGRDNDDYKLRDDNDYNHGDDDDKHGYDDDKYGYDDDKHGDDDDKRGDDDDKRGDDDDKHGDDDDRYRDDDKQGDDDDNHRDNYYDHNKHRDDYKYRDNHYDHYKHRDEDKQGDDDDNHRDNYYDHNKRRDDYKYRDNHYDHNKHRDEDHDYKYRDDDDRNGDYDLSYGGRTNNETRFGRNRRENIRRFNYRGQEED